MNCPVCKTAELLMAERQGVEIDYCPQCRGIWLDRGELDKIIERFTAENTNEAERATKAQPPPRQPEYPPPFPQQHGHNYGYDKHHEQKHHGYGGYSGHHKKKSLLKELFDF